MKNKSILKKVNLSFYDNNVFEKVINETDQFVQKAKLSIASFLKESNLPNDLALNIKEQISKLSINTQETCNYLKIFEIEEPSKNSFNLKKEIENTLLNLESSIQEKNLTVVKKSLKRYENHS